MTFHLFSFFSMGLVTQNSDEEQVERLQREEEEREAAKEAAKKAKEEVGARKSLR